MKWDSTSTLAIKFSEFSSLSSLESSKLFLNIKLLFATGSMRELKIVLHNERDKHVRTSDMNYLHGSSKTSG